MPKRIAIIGGGPVGLEAALAARQRGYAVKVYERGRIGEHLQQWGHVRLFSPFKMNTTPQGRNAIMDSFGGHAFPADSDCILAKEHGAAYLEPLSKVKELAGCIEQQTQVIQVSRQHFLKEDSPGQNQRAEQPFRLLVRHQPASGGRQPPDVPQERIDPADFIFDCSGTYAQPRWLGEGGIPARGELSAKPHIRYWIDDVLGEKKGQYAGKTTLVLGGGFSAAASVCALAELAKSDSNTWIIWLARTSATQPLRRVMNDPLRERDRLAVAANMLATRGDGNVEFHASSLVQAVEFLGSDKGFRVTATVDRKEKIFEVDRLIANVGYSPDASLYRELQVHECYASLGPMKLAAALLGGDCLQQTTHGPDTLRNPEPNFFILGSKSYGRNSNFLMRIGFEQIEEVFSLLP